MRLSFNFITGEKRSANSTLKRPADWLIKWLGVETSSGIDVNPDTALKFSAVYACIARISENFGSLPKELLIKDDEGRRPATDHYLYNIIHNSPNQYSNSTDFHQTIQAQVCARGNGYARIHRKGDVNKVEYLEYIPSAGVTPVVRNNKLFYAVQGEKEATPGSDMIHIKNLSLDGVNGISPITYHRETIGNALGAQKYNGKFFKNGGFIKGYLKVPGQLKEGRDKVLSRQWQENYGNLDAELTTPVLDSLAEFKPVGISQRDAQYIESQKFSREEIAGIYNVPLALIGDESSSNYNSLEQRDIHFVKYCLRPFIKKWEEEYNYKLLTVQERRQGYHFKINMNALLRGDTASRTAMYKDLFYIGGLNPNEIRDMEGFNARQGGDDYFTPSNMLSMEQLELLIQQMKKQNKEP